MEHSCAPSNPNGLFCADCGKLLEPGSLRKVKLRGFVGPASLVPSIEHFWETGDAEVFNKPGV